MSEVKGAEKIGKVAASSTVSPKKEHVQVRYTGDWSSDSKLSAITNGYWEDPFLSFFNTVNPIPRRTSLICRGYYVRFRVCDFFLRNILDVTEEPIQIVSLGCGMDTTFFRMLPQYESKISRFFELDFESVIQAKRQIVSTNEILQVMNGGKLCLLAADLRNLDSLRDTLKNGKFDFDKPAVFYSECVVNYLAPKESEAILKWIVANVPHSMWLAYEQCNANDSFGKIMTRHFEKNGCALLSLPPNPDVEAQRKLLKNVGFHKCYVFNTWDCFLYLTRNENTPFPKISSTRQQFDEYEALLTTCLHYSVRIGMQGITGAISNFIYSTASAISQILEPNENLKQPVSITLTEGNCFEAGLEIREISAQLTGHTSVSSGSSNELFLLGGITSASQRSARLDKIQIQFSANETRDCLWTETIRDEKIYFERLYSTAIFHPLSQSFYIFGGRKSPQVPCSTDLVQVLAKSSHVLKSLNFGGENCPSPRWRHGMVLAGQSLLIFGGKNHEKVLGDCWTFNFMEGAWTEHKYSQMTIPSARHSHSMCINAADNQIYCIGGILKDDTTLCVDAVWRYTHANDKDSQSSGSKWTNVPELSIYGRRIGHSTAVQNNTLFIVGGVGANSASSLQHFATLINLRTQSVKTIDLNLSPRNLFLPFGFSLSAIKGSSEQIGSSDSSSNQDEKLIVYGGGGNCFSFGSHFNDWAFILHLDKDLFSNV